MFTMWDKIRQMSSKDDDGDLDGVITITAGRATDLFLAAASGIVDGNVRITFIDKDAIGRTLDLEPQTATVVRDVLSQLLEIC